MQYEIVEKYLCVYSISSSGGGQTAFLRTKGCTGAMATLTRKSTYVRQSALPLCSLRFAKKLFKGISALRLSSVLATQLFVS